MHRSPLGKALGAMTLLLACSVAVSAQNNAPGQGSATPAPPAVRFVTVAPGVRLQVLDWGGPRDGGNAPSLVFLAGLGSTAHVFDPFAPLFTAHHHVYGITRRGFGDSSHPAPTPANYSADRLGEDVLAAIDALHLRHPVLIGHSIAGEELSWMGTHHPDRIAGLVYLDAAYGFAYDDPQHPEWVPAMNELRRQIDALEAGGLPNEQQFLLHLQAQAESFTRALAAYNVMNVTMPPPPPRSPLIAAITFGEVAFGPIPNLPILAVYACPHTWDWAFPHDPAALARRLRDDTALCTAHMQDFAQAMPQAQIVRLRNADHFVFRSNPDVVRRAIDHFLERVD